MKVVPLDSARLQHKLMLKKNFKIKIGRLNKVYEPDYQRKLRIDRGDVVGVAFAKRQKIQKTKHYALIGVVRAADKNWVRMWVVWHRLDRYSKEAVVEVSVKDIVCHFQCVD